VCELETQFRLVYARRYKQYDCCRREDTVRVWSFISARGDSERSYPGAAHETYTPWVQLRFSYGDSTGAVGISECAYKRARLSTGNYNTGVWCARTRIETRLADIS